MMINRATNEQFNFAERILNQRIKPKSDDVEDAKKRDRFQQFINSGAFVGITKKFDPFWDKIFDLVGDQYRHKLSDILNCREPFSGPAMRLQGLLELMSKAIDKQEVELNSDSVLSKMKDQLKVYIGGLDNALKTQIGLAVLAFEKVAKFCDGNREKFAQLIGTVFDTNRHIATQFGDLHIAVMQLVETLSGIVVNQDQMYIFDSDNFELAKSPDLRDDKIYLLPTMKFLDKVITSSKDQDTNLSLHRFGTKIEVPFALAHTGPIMGCPLFRSTKDREGQVFKLEDWFFNTTTTFIKGCFMPFVDSLDKKVMALKGAQRLQS